MKYFILCLLFFSFSLFAQEVEIEVSPKEPLVGESFNLNFKIKTTSTSQPDISFNPYGAEVVGKQNQGISVRTMFINGRLSTTRELNISYEMIAQRAGTVRINDIVVDVDGQIFKKPGFSINVLREPKQLPPVMAMAVVDKQSAFVGEGLTVRYYLYAKTNVMGTEIKEFPKLNRFFKRFLQENSHPERVEYEGEVYNRSLVYSARLFADKEGKFFVDPITLRVQFQERSRQDPFGSFGGLAFGGGKLTQRNVSSRSLEIEIKKLPADNVPPHFTGLVGKHSFDLTFSKTKFLVNEPVEFKLKVTGPGNLESFDAPKLLTNPAFEEFETNTDLALETDITATKTFDYTYLGRTKAHTPATNLPLAYFNPETQAYVTVNVNLPEITLEGEGVAPVKEDKVDEEKNETKLPQIFATKTPSSPKTFRTLAPILSFHEPKNNPLNWLNGILVFILALSLLWHLPFWRNSKRKSPLDNAVQALQKNGLSYYNLHQFFELASQSIHGTSYKGVQELLGDLPLSAESKRYFDQLVEEMEKREFYDKRIPLKQGFEKKAFSELLNCPKLKNK